MKPLNLALICILLCPTLMMCNKKSGQLAISGSYHSSTITEYDDPVMYTKGKTITEKMIIEKFIKQNSVVRIGFGRERTPINSIKFQFNDTGAVIKKELTNDLASFKIKTSQFILLEYFGLRDNDDGYYDIVNCLSLKDVLFKHKVNSLCPIPGFPSNCLYSKFLAIGADGNHFFIRPLSYYTKLIGVDESGLSEITCIAENDHVHNEVNTNFPNSLKNGDTVILQYGKISLIKD